MAEPIPFNRSFEYEHGKAEWLTPRVRRIVANNPGPFTFTGTNTYFVGIGDVTLIDPGPDDASHFQAITGALRDEKVTRILLTHTHRDHSALAKRVSEYFAAPIYIEGPHRPARSPLSGPAPAMEAGADGLLVPDHVLKEGDCFSGEGWTLETILCPGHAENHAAFVLKEDKAIFSGDHVMGWATSVIAPPDGSMAAYMNSLRKFAERGEALYWPGHGAPVTNAQSFTKAFIKHRLMREASIVNFLRAGGSNIPPIVEALYKGLNPELHKAAAYSVFAHLEYLAQQGAVTADPELNIDATFEITK